MARRTKEEAERTREQLIDAAETVFHRKGVSCTSLNEIACEAGLTRGAIYWHFKNKHDVFEAMLTRQTLPLEQLGALAKNPDEPDPLGRLRELLLFVTREVKRDPSRRRVYEIVFQKCELTEENEPLGSLHRHSFQTGSESMHGTFENAIRQGQLPDNIDIDGAITHLHVQLTGVIYLWLLMPDSFDIETESTRLIDSFFDYLLPSRFLLSE